MSATAGSALSPFCLAYDIVQAAPQNPALGPVTLGGVITTGACDSSSATISFSSVTIGGDTVPLSGSIDSSGNLTGTYTPSSADLAGVQVSTITVTAALAADGSITDLTGTATGSGVPFVSLPQGWSGTTTLTLTTAGVAVSVDADDGAQSTSGHITLAGTLNFDGTFTLTATVANLAVLTTADEEEATASGTGSITRSTPGGPVTHDINASLKLGASPVIQLFDNTTLSNGSATLDDKGIHVSGDLTIAALGSDLELDLTGDYQATDDFSLTATQPTPWSSAGVTLSNLTGTLVDNGTLTFDVSGDVTETQLSSLGEFSDVSLGAQVANTCPPNGKDPSCSDTAVQLNLTLDATVTVPGDSQPTPLQATATVDFATMAYSFDASMPGNFGPAELNLSDLQLTLTDQPTAQTCVAGTTSGSADGAGQLQLGFAGKSTVMGVTAGVSGIFTGDSDYCLEVDLASAGFNPDGGSGGTSSAFESATLIYSTTAISAPSVAANSPTLIGTFRTPQTLQSIFDQQLQPSATYTVNVTLGSDGEIDGFEGSVDLPLQNSGALLAGSRDGTSLTLDSIQVSANYDVSQAQTSLTIAADGDLNTDGGGMPSGSTDNAFPVAGQSTPVTGKITATLSKTGASVAFTVGVDPQQTTGCPPSESPCITDAFGQTGLIVHTLSIGGSIQATEAGVTPAVDVAAHVVLPAAWTSHFGIDNGVAVSLAIQLSETNPCFQLTIGDTNGKDPVVSMVDGLFVADYAEVAIAPMGCSFDTAGGETVAIPAGASLAFTGQILGDPIAFNATMGTDDSGAPYVNAMLQSAPIDFAGGAITVTAPNAGSDASSSAEDCSNTATSNDNSPVAGGPFVEVDTRSGGASVCGAIDVGDTGGGGSGVTVSIQYTSDGPEARFNVEADVSPGGFTIAQAALQGDYVGGRSPTLDISLSGGISALAVEIDLIGQLDYERGTLAKAGFGFDTNADLFGILDVNVGFILAYVTDPKTDVGTTIFTYEASAAIFGWSIFYFGGTIFTTTGGWQQDGSPLPPPPLPPPPPVQISASQVLDDAFIELLAHLGYPAHRSDLPEDMSCRQQGCYYLYRDVAAPIAPDGTIATPTGQPGGSPDGLLLVCFATWADQQQNRTDWRNEQEQLEEEGLSAWWPRPVVFIEPNIRSATSNASDPTGTDSCASLKATYNLDSGGNLYIASAGSFDWNVVKKLEATS